MVYHNIGGVDTAVGGLLDGHSYYVITLDPMTIELAATAADAQAGRFIRFLTAGVMTSASQTLTPVNAAATERFNPLTAISTTAGGVSPQVTAKGGGVSISATDTTSVTATAGGVAGGRWPAAVRSGSR